MSSKAKKVLGIVFAIIALGSVMLLFAPNGDQPLFGRAFALGCGAVVGLLIVALMVVATRKENAVAIKYDERQIAEQGKSFKYGFVAMIVYYGLVMIIGEAGINLPTTNEVLIFVGILVGVAFMFTNSILKDAYFRLDENKKGIIGFFVFLTLFNFLIGILNIVNDRAIVDGRITFIGTANLLCAIMLLYALSLIFVSAIRRSEALRTFDVMRIELSMTSGARGMHCMMRG